MPHASRSMDRVAHSYPGLASVGSSFKALQQLLCFRESFEITRFKALKTYRPTKQLAFKGLRRKTYLPERKILRQKVTTPGGGGHRETPSASCSDSRQPALQFFNRAASCLQEFCPHENAPSPHRGPRFYRLFCCIFRYHPNRAGAAGRRR